MPILLFPNAKFSAHIPLMYDTIVVKYPFIASGNSDSLAVIEKSKLQKMFGLPENATLRFLIVATIP